jgi:hypothetical protein
MKGWRDEGREYMDGICTTTGRPVPLSLLVWSGLAWPGLA